MHRARRPPASASAHPLAGRLRGTPAYQAPRRDLALLIFYCGPAGSPRRALPRASQPRVCLTRVRSLRLVLLQTPASKSRPRAPVVSRPRNCNVRQP
eukprot:3819709-Pyramimonas_sp.AAC.1